MKYQAGSYKHILSLSLPIIIGSIAQNIILATDALFMAGVNEVALDAVGLGGLYYGTLFVLGLGFANGVQILIARRHGEKNLPAIGQVFNSSMQILFSVGLLLWGVIEILSPVLLPLIIHSKPVYEQTTLYLEQRAWGILFAFFSLGFRSLYIGVSSSLVITMATSVTALVNVFFNYVLIFGHWGFPELGITGAGMASSIAEVFGTLAFLLYMWYKKSIHEFALFRNWTLNTTVIRQVSRLASPMMLQFFFSHLGWFIFFLIIERLGERALAISVLIRIIYMFEMVPFWGYNASANTIVSYLIGEKKNNQVMPSLKRICILSFASSLIFIVPNMLFPEWVISLAAGSNSPAGLVADSVPTLRVVSLSLFLFALSMTFFSGITGSGNTRFALAVELITIFFYILIAWVLGRQAGIEVHEVWFTEVYYFLMLGAISFWYMHTGRWKRSPL